MDNKPWKDEKRLRELHQDRGLSGAQMAPILGCSSATVLRWLDRFGIFTPVEFRTTPDKGYEKWRNGDSSLYHHRLLAVAEYGFDAVVGKRIHHKNDIPWDNRPENIIPLSRSEHQQEHTKEPRISQKAIAYAYEFTDMSSYEVAETCSYCPQSVRRFHQQYFG